MPEVVQVSTVENDQKLITAIEAYFKKGHYAEITRAIGMHSALVEPGHMLGDQTRMYRIVLNLVKNKLAGTLGKNYAGWYSDFPHIVEEFLSSGKNVNDKHATAALASHRSAYGPFKSVDDFFFWALDDRRLTLEQIVKFLEKTAAKHC